MTTQPDPNFIGGSRPWAVQADVDSIKRALDHRIDDVATRVDKSVTTVEYVADKRFQNLQLENLNDKLDVLESAIQLETFTRIADQKDDIKTRQTQFRWLVSAVLIPIILAVMDLMLNKK